MLSIFPFTLCTDSDDWLVKRTILKSSSSVILRFLTGKRWPPRCFLLLPPHKNEIWASQKLETIEWLTILCPSTIRWCCFRFHCCSSIVQNCIISLSFIFYLRARTKNRNLLYCTPLCIMIRLSSLAMRTQIHCELTTWSRSRYQILHLKN